MTTGALRALLVVVLACSVRLTCPAAHAAADQLPADVLPAYQRRDGVVGRLASQGSDTMNNLMTLWAETFRRLYPNVTVSVQGSGSSAAPPALTQGTASFGPMSRRMKPSELAAFRRRYGYEPVPIAVAIDAVAIYVHKDNPITALSITQLDAAFSMTRRCGAREEISRWGHLGMPEPWASRSMTLFGRNSVSGTYGYFKQFALCSGDYRNSVNEQPGSASVVQSVAAAPDSLGYSGIGYRTAGVRAVPLASDASSTPIAPTHENALNGSYPLTRFLYLYVNFRPGSGLPVVEEEFVKMILSALGQNAVARDGYIPLPRSVLERERQKLQAHRGGESL